MPYELVEVYVGPSDGPGEESFCLTVCTPAALVEVLADQPVLVGRHWLFVAEFSPRMVEEFLRRRIGEIAGMTWSEAAQQVRRLGPWVAGVRGSRAREQDMRPPARAPTAPPRAGAGRRG